MCGDAVVMRASEGSGETNSNRKKIRNKIANKKKRLFEFVERKLVGQTVIQHLGKEFELNPNDFTYNDKNHWFLLHINPKSNLMTVLKNRPGYMLKNIYDAIKTENLSEDINVIFEEKNSHIVLSKKFEEHGYSSNFRVEIVCQFVNGYLYIEVLKVKSRNAKPLTKKKKGEETRI